MFYKLLEFLVPENVLNPLLLLMLDRTSYIYVGRQGFGSVNPENQMIKGLIIEVLLYMVKTLKNQLSKNVKFSKQLKTS